MRNRELRQLPRQTSLLFIIGATAGLVLLNVAVARQELPEYGTWTGIRPLEEKLHKLERFASDERVDAVVLGSSISDFGFSAESFSASMTAATGSRYRTFNFSTGATEIVTMPKLYRLVRTVARPRTLLVVHPAELKRPNFIPPRSPDYIMERAPIRRSLEHPWLLPAEKRLWEIPLIRYASPLRDLLIFGSFVNLAPQGSDLYYMNEFGDTVSFSYQSSGSDLRAARAAHQTTLTPLSEDEMAALDQRAMLAHYFNGLDIAAMAELRSLAASDDCEIVVVAHAPAAIFFPEPASDDPFIRAQRQFFTILAEALGARLVYNVEKYRAPKFAITDSVHLNRHGADQFTRLVARDLTGHAVEMRATPRTSPKHARLLDLPSDDVTVNAWSAIIEAPKAEHDRTLRLGLLRNRAIPELPTGGLAVMLRLPDDSDVVAPARITSDGTVEATFSGLRSDSDQLLLARIVSDAGGRFVALNQPLKDYAWSDK